MAAGASWPGGRDEGSRRASGVAPGASGEPAPPGDQAPFGRYLIQRRLGQGGMAVVYDAYDPKHDRHVALKVLKPEWQREPEALERFLREARAGGGLSGPSIVIVYESGEEPAPFIAMELIEGPTLAEYLRRRGRLAAAEAVRLVRGLCEALAYAHARGRVHRDIKPSNILLSGPELAPKLADFGIALIAAEAAQLTRYDHTPGTPRYMSPEQWRGEPVDARSDLFSLGVTFYEMLTGRRAFAGETAEALGYQITREPPPRLRELAPRTPPAIAAIVDRLIAKRLGDRFQSAQELLAALDASSRAYPHLSRRTAITAAAGLIVTIAGAGLWWATPGNRPPVARPAERAIEAGQVMEIDLGTLVSDPDRDRLELAAELARGAPGSLELEGTRLRYDPGPSFATVVKGESRTGRIRYRASDGRGERAAADIVVRVLGTRTPNRPPTTVEDRARASPGERVVLDVVANDRDLDPGDRPQLIAAELGSGSPGAVSIVAGRIAYDPGPAATPPPAQPLVAEIRYTIADRGGARAPGRAWIRIEPPLQVLHAKEPPLVPEAPPRAAPSRDDRRCRHVVERFQLGGLLSDEDRALLQSRCKP
jgi:tRNA A-37 threonylcarbamoyl transferase component Bud32